MRGLLLNLIAMFGGVRQNKYPGRMKMQSPGDIACEFKKVV